jgi:hypothetical protein
MRMSSPFLPSPSFALRKGCSKEQKALLMRRQGAWRPGARSGGAGTQRCSPLGRCSCSWSCSGPLASRSAHPWGPWPGVRRHCHIYAWLFGLCGCAIRVSCAIHAPPCSLCCGCVSFPVRGGSGAGSTGTCAGACVHAQAPGHFTTTMTGHTFLVSRGLP